MSVLDGVELAFVTGKGGVGKTTVALATALAAARDGRRVVLCEVAGQARAARLYGADAPRPGREVALEDGLWATTIDPVLALEEWAGRQIGSRRLVGLLTHSNAFAAFVNAAPGARELVAITKAWELGAAPALGQGPRAATTSSSSTGRPAATASACCARPHTFAEIARVGPIAAQARKVVAAAGGPGAQRGRRRRAPGRAVDQRDARPRGARDGRRRAPARRESSSTACSRGASAPREVDRLMSSDGAVPGPVAAAARRQHGQASTQQSQLRRLRRHTAAHVTTLPYVPAPHLGLDDVRGLADELARRL